MAKPRLRVSGSATEGRRNAVAKPGDDLTPKASRLVRYPNPSNALRALLTELQDDPDVAGGTARSRPGRVLAGHDVGLKPSPPERSRPSANALDLLRGAGAAPSRRRPPGRAQDRSLPRIAPAEIADGLALGEMVRVRRLMLKLTQKGLADAAGVGRRFVGELEAGKPSVELGKTLGVCQTLGLSLTLQMSDGG